MSEETDRTKDYQKPKLLLLKEALEHVPSPDNKTNCIISENSMSILLAARECLVELKRLYPEKL